MAKLSTHIDQPPKEELSGFAAALASILSTTANILPQLGVNIGGGGNSGADRRAQIRNQLETQGFRWDHTKGAQPEDRNNIDGFDDQALNNLVSLYSAYGQPVVQAHNQGMFTKQNLRDMDKWQTYFGGSVAGFDTNTLVNFSIAAAVVGTGTYAYAKNKKKVNKKIASLWPN